MKRKHQGNWQDNVDPRDIPNDLEEEKQVKSYLPDGNEPDSDYLWQRPNAAYEQLDQKHPDTAPSQRRGQKSSEALYERASQAQQQSEHDEFFYKRKKNPRVLVMRTLVTLVLIGVIGILVWAITEQIALRESLQEGQNPGSSYSSEHLDMTNSNNDSNETSGNTDNSGVIIQPTSSPIQTQSIEIVGNWVDRRPTSSSSESDVTGTGSENSEITSSTEEG